MYYMMHEGAEGPVAAQVRRRAEQLHAAAGWHRGRDREGGVAILGPRGACLCPCEGFLSAACFS